MDQEQMGSPVKPPIPKWLIITLAIVVVAALGLGGWYFLGQKSMTTVKTSPSPTTTSKVSPSASVSVSPTASSSVPADWKTYTSTTYNYSVKYPEDWFTKEENAYAFFDKVEIISSDEGYSTPISIGVTTDTPTKVKAGYTVKSETPITIGGVPAAKISTTDKLTNAALTIVIAQKDTNTFLLFTKSGYEDTLNSMLSTFQFTK